MIISVAGLESGETYSIYAGGTENQSFTVDSNVVEAGGSANGMGGMGQGGGPGMGGGRGQMNEGEMPQGEMPQGEMPENFNGERPQMNKMDKNSDL